MADLSVHMNVILDGLEVTVSVEGDRSLATDDVMAAARRAAARASKAMQAALDEPPAGGISLAAERSFFDRGSGASIDVKGGGVS